MIQDAKCSNWSDEAGNPTGGTYSCTGLSVEFQNGPRNVDGSTAGCYVEDLLTCAIARLAFYQGDEESGGTGKFNCKTNQDALDSCRNALASLESRTKARTDQGVEGKNEAHAEA